MIVIGLKTCDTCRKAFRSLKTGNDGVVLRDVRDDPLSSDELGTYLELFGADLVNTRSTTWRGLSESERNEPPAHLLKQHPALMKRPVIVSDTGTTLGWSDDIRQQHLG